MLASLLALACAVYFAILAGMSLRNGEAARFFTGNIVTDTLFDSIETLYPNIHGYRYVSRREKPIQFWIAIAIRCFVAAIAVFLAVWFFVAAMGS